MFIWTCWLTTTSNDASVEWQLGDVGGADVDQVAEPDGVVEPLGDVAVLGCDVDGGDAGAPLGSDQSRGCPHGLVSWGGWVIGPRFHFVDTVHCSACVDAVH
jgi:hypothetical protein